MTAKEVRPSSREGANAISPVSKSKRKLHTCKDANQRIKKAKDSSRRLPVITDAEICRYIHSENEMQLKKIIWEVMNKNHVERKRPVKAKKVGPAPAKQLVKTDVQEENNKRLSSRINFDSLKKLNEDLDNNSEGSQGECLNSNHVHKSDSRRVSAKGCSSRETECNDEYEIGSEELDTNREYNEDEDQGFDEEYFFDDY